MKIMYAGKFKAVLFDLESTLIKTADPPIIFKRILEAHGIKISIQNLSKAHRKNQEHLNIEEMAEKGLDYWIEWNMKILEQVGIRKNREFLARKIDELWFEHAELGVYSDVDRSIERFVVNLSVRFQFFPRCRVFRFSRF